ncbi:MAG: sensor histidine kinase [Chloroflexota bacterium]
MVAARPPITEQLRGGALVRPMRPFRWALVAIVAFALAASVLAIEGYQAQISRLLNEAQLRARGAAADVDRYVQSRWWTLQAIGEAAEIKDGDVAGMRPLFDAMDPASLGLDAGIAWIDPSGMMRVRTGGYDGPPIDFSTRAHIQEALRTHRPVISGGIQGAVNQAPIVAFVVPVFDDSGRFTGLLGSGIRLDRLSVGADSIRYAGGTDVEVLDRAGLRIAGDQPVTTLEVADPRFPFGQLVEGGQGAMRVPAGPDGEPDQLMGYAVADTSGWLVLVERSAGETYGSATLTLVTQLLAIALGVVAAVALLAWAARRLDRALKAQSAAYAAERVARQELQEALRVQEHRQAIRDAFVGVMSHELRTPVTTIYGAAKLLVRDPRRPELESLLEDIEGEAERLRRITEDLLVLSRAEHGLLEVVAEPIRVPQVVAVSVADAQRRRPDATIEVRMPGALPPISADAGYLRQILDNLIGNALKYGRGAPVTVSAASVGDRVRLVVEDAGPGVPPEDLPHIQELFYRSPATERSAAGTGIGLFVVQQLSAAMGGTVEVAAAEPHGLRVTLTFAADPAWVGSLLENASVPGPTAARPAVVPGAVTGAIGAQGAGAAST